MNATTKKKIICHEAGHVVLSEVLCPGSVALVSAYGGARFGGFTSFYNPETLDLLAWEESRIISTLGGKAAVELVWGELDLGADNDLQQVMASIGRLVKDYAADGFMNLFDNNTCTPGEEKRNSYDKAIAERFDKYYARAKELLEENKTFLEKVIEALTKKNILSRNEIQDIKKACEGQ